MKEHRSGATLESDRGARYAAGMSNEHLTRDALALPLAERVALAQALWQSIDDEPGGEAADDEERDAVDLAHQRDRELASGAVAGRTHEQVMEAARRIVECG
jgi:putative addiction module component (TIGR02574 family)